jgi:hypothetical protein
MTRRTVPYTHVSQYRQELLDLAAAGVVRLPKKPFRREEILAMPVPGIPLDKLLASLQADREES